MAENACDTCHGLGRMVVTRSHLDSEGNTVTETDIEACPECQGGGVK